MQQPWPTVVDWPQRPPATILVHQFRPPVNKIVVELPAGLVDKDESIQEAALRESVLPLVSPPSFLCYSSISSASFIVARPRITRLFEETGYSQSPHGGTTTIDHVSHILVVSPLSMHKNSITMSPIFPFLMPSLVPFPQKDPGMSKANMFKSRRRSVHVAVELE